MDSGNAPRTSIECYRSRPKLFGLFVLTAAMVAMCSFLATQPGALSKIVGWIGIAFFGLGFIAIPVMFFRTGPQVVINDEGIDDRRTKVGVIRWDDIRSVSIRSVSSTKFLCVDLSDPDKYLSRLPRGAQMIAAANRKLGFATLSIGFSGLTPGLDPVWEYVSARKPHTLLEPESRFVVKLSDTEIVCERPDGRVERVAWNDLTKVEILTTADGPLVPDVFWILHGSDGGCAIPQGATGERELLARLQTLSKFANDAVIEAMVSTSDRRFLCWQKDA